jgi:hypothetical protein
VSNLSNYADACAEDIYIAGPVAAVGCPNKSDPAHECKAHCAAASRLGNSGGGCPNELNPYHTCSQYCKRTYQIVAAGNDATLAGGGDGSHGNVVIVGCGGADAAVANSRRKAGNWFSGTAVGRPVADTITVSVTVDTSSKSVGLGLDAGKWTPAFLLQLATVSSPAQHFSTEPTTLAYFWRKVAKAVATGAVLVEGASGSSKFVVVGVGGVPSTVAAGIPTAEQALATVGIVDGALVRIALLQTDTHTHQPCEQRG